MSVFQRFRRAVFELEDKDMGDVLEELIERWLSEVEQPPPKQTQKRKSDRPRQ